MSDAPRYTNPYQSPAILNEHSGALSVPSSGCWRDGRYVVVSLPAVLPPRCVWTNEPVVSVDDHVLIWNPRWVNWTLLLGPLAIFFLVATERKIHLQVPIGETILARRRRQAWLGVPTLLLEIVLLGAAMVLHPGSPVIALPMLALFITVAILAFATLKLSLKRVEQGYAWLGGAGKPFLESLPIWDGTGEIMACPPPESYNARNASTTNQQGSRQQWPDSP